MATHRRMGLSSEDLHVVLAVGRGLEGRTALFGRTGSIPAPEREPSLCVGSGADRVHRPFAPDHHLLRACAGPRRPCPTWT
jgi:hypothetical protein